MYCGSSIALVYLVALLVVAVAVPSFLCVAFCSYAFRCVNFPAIFAELTHYVSIPTQR